MSVNPVVPHLQLHLLALQDDEAVQPKEVRAFLDRFSKDLSFQDLPALYLLRDKVAVPELAQEIAKVIGSCQAQHSEESLFLTELVKLRTRTEEAIACIKEFVTLMPPASRLAKTIKILREKMPHEMPLETFIKTLVLLTTLLDIQIISLPFFSSCQEQGVDPFSLLYAKKMGTLPKAVGYTNAHLAALELDVPTLSELFARGVNFMQKSPLGGTVYDFLRYRGHAIRESSSTSYPEAISRFYTCQNILSFTACQKLIGAKARELHPYEQAAFTQFLKRKMSGEKPPVYPARIEQESALKGQYQLCASRDIDPGEFIVEYRGEIGSSSGGDLTYRYSITDYEPLYIDAKAHGCFAELINHGAPNSRMFVFADCGILHIGIMALRVIAKDEPILLNYRKEYFRFFAPVELSPSAIDAFLQETNDLQVLFPLSAAKQENGRTLEVGLSFAGPNPEMIQKVTKRHTEKVQVEQSYLQHMLDYVFTFPSRLFFHVKSGRIPAHRIATLLDTFLANNQMEVLGLSLDEALAMKMQLLTLKE